VCFREPPFGERGLYPLALAKMAIPVELRTVMSLGALGIPPESISFKCVAPPGDCGWRRVLWLRGTVVDARAPRLPAAGR